jgi:hypothetical protein
MLLPEADAARSLIAAYASVRVEFQQDLGERKLVLANGDFFPDAFHHDQQSAEALVRRMRLHAGMLDIPLRTQVSLGTAAPASSCGVGCAAPAAGSDLPRLVDRGEEWELSLTADELRHPVGLTTLVARALALVFLVETRREDSRLRIPDEVLVDLLAVGLGFGALLMEGAYVYSKSCGGPNVAKLTALGLPELGLTTALFCAKQPKALRAAKNAASTTQAATLDAAIDWLAGNRDLAARVHDAPELVQGGAFELGAPRSSLFSWFGSRAQPAAELEPLALAPAPKRTASPPPDDGLKELVEEVLGSR